MPPSPDTAAAGLAEPWRDAWPDSGLEAVPHCPVCGSAERTAWHGALRDNTFRTARGLWQMWRCTRCSAGFLDPRPNPQTIHLAYGSYYTHGEAAPAPAPLSGLRRLRQAWTQGYTQARYGAPRDAAPSFGAAVTRALPLLRKRADREFRHLPTRPSPPSPPHPLHPQPGPGSVLDVGCGDGAFLALARRCGWTVLGLEPDPKAASAAAQQGVTVIEGGLERLQDRSAAFDVVTLAHVIEHVHDPVGTLKECLRLLKPGGRLWIETPNADSLGHRLFGANWRGIEAPRHLVLFNRQSLLRALRDAGFEDVRDLPAPSPRRWIFQRCLALRADRLSEDVRPLPRPWLLKALAGDLRDALGARQAEFLTIAARRPG